MKLPRLLAGASASAFLLALGLPNEAFLYGVPLLGFLALIPFYFVLLEASSWFRIFLVSGAFGGLSHAFSSYWLYFFHGFALWTLGSTIIAYFVVYGVYGLYLGFILKRGNGARPLVFAFAWVALEYAKSTGFLGYPWGLLAYTQTRVLPMLQIADTTGVYGISFVVAFCNASLAEVLAGMPTAGRPVPRALSPIFLKGKRTRLGLPRPAGLRPGSGLFTLGLAFFLLAANLGYGAWSLAHPLPLKGRFSVVLVQQNLDPWDAGEEEGLRLNLTLARDAMAKATHRPDIILFSESTLSRPYADFLPWFESHPAGNGLIPFIRQSGAWLFTGAPIVLDWAKEEATNSVILIDPQGRQRGDYAKVHPVPFAEAIPFWDFGPFRRFIQKVVGLDSGWVMGTKYTVFSLPTPSGTYTFGAPICFEDAFPDVCREFFRQDVDLLINLTNDSWSKTESSEIQHFAAARFRAIEARRTLVRSTNGGVSAVVDAQGKVLESLPLFKALARQVEVPVSRGRGMTAYVRFGDWFALWSIGMAGLFFLLSAFRGGRAGRRRRGG